MTVDSEESRAILGRVEEAVTGCLASDPLVRWTVPRVLDAFESVRVDAAGLARHTRMGAASDATYSNISGLDCASSCVGTPSPALWCQSPVGGATPTVVSPSVVAALTPQAVSPALRTATPVSPSIEGASTPMLPYDVLAIIDAMEAVGVEAAVIAAVADAIGGSLTATLDVLTAKKVPIMKAASVRKALAAVPQDRRTPIEMVSVGLRG